MSKAKPRYLSVRLTTEQLEALKELADLHGRSQQQEAEWVLDQAIEREKRKRRTP